MNIITENHQKKLQELILTHAKYQKVMLIYDSTCTNMEIHNIYESVKEVCVFNKLEITQDLNEIYNGYRLIIFLCSANSYLSFNLDVEEFVNVYLPTDNNIMPFFLGHNKQHNNFMFVNPNQIEINMHASIYFNKFYSYFFNLVNKQQSYEELMFFAKEMSLNNYANELNLLDEEFCFVDVDILKKCNLNYSNLLMVDYLLISAFSLLINSIKSKTLSIVDVYKAAKDDSKLIDKFYAISTNETLKQITILNFNSLASIIDKVKCKILDYINISEIPAQSEINKMINKIKDYSKTSGNLTSYLYFYNIFDT